MDINRNTTRLRVYYPLRNGEIEQLIVHAVRCLAITIVRKPEKSVFKNTIFNHQDAELLQLPVTRSIVWAQATGRQFVFCDRKDDIIAIVNIKKPIPVPLEAVNVDEASSSRVGHTITFSDFYEETYIMFGKEFLQTRKPRKLIMVDTTSSVRYSKGLCA